MKRLLCVAAATYCIFFGGLSFYHGSIHTGAWLLLGFGVLLLLFGLIRVPSAQRTGARRCYRVFAGVFWTIAAVGTLLSAAMIYAGWFRPPEQQTSTMIVLGCQASNGRPSLVLRLRIDRAARYLLAHPEIPVVATGGYNSPEETMSEAQVIERELISYGISPDRIYRDDRSKNTKENLLYAAEVIDENQLPGNVIIVTDGFHQLRGQLYALRAGLQQPAGLASRTPWGLAPSYWVREWGGIAKMALER